MESSWDGVLGDEMEKSSRVTDPPPTSAAGDVSRRPQIDIRRGFYWAPGLSETESNVSVRARGEICGRWKSDRMTGESHRMRELEC